MFATLKIPRPRFAFKQRIAIAYTAVSVLGLCVINLHKTGIVSITLFGTVVIDGGLSC